MNSTNSYCIFRELVRSFAKEYFYGRLQWNYEEIRDRINKFKVLNCNSINNLKDEEIADILKELWSFSYTKKEETKKSDILKNISSVRNFLKKILCREVNLNKEYLEILREIRFKYFGLARLTELACFLFPDRFFIVNERVVNAFNYLSKRGVLIVKREYHERKSRGFKELLNKYISGEAKGEKEQEAKKVFQELQETLELILRYFREIKPVANYADADAFIYFVSMAAELKKGKRGESPSEHVGRIESSFAKSPREVLDEWIDQSIKACEQQSIVPQEVEPCLNLDGRDKKIVAMISDSLSTKKQIVLYGVPGTGKTFLARCVALGITRSKDKVKFITFHPSYSYEDFVEGIRPDVSKAGGELEFRIEQGIFKKMVAVASCDLINYVLRELKETTGIEEIRGCADSRRIEPDLIDEIIEKVLDVKGKLEELRVPREKLRKLIDNGPKYVLVIDEINRGDMARILGELITLLEDDKRLFEENEITVQLPYSKKLFFIPPNLYIIGTMNSADRSIAFVDYALRRRFGFIELEPDPDKVAEVVDGFSLREFFIALNEYLVKVIDRDHRIGHSYFMNIDSLEKLRNIWFTQIRPLLMEFFYGRDDEIKAKLIKLYTDPFIDDLEKFREELNKVLVNLRELTR